MLCMKELSANHHSPPSVTSSYQDSPRTRNRMGGKLPKPNHENLT